MDLTVKEFAMRVELLLKPIPCGIATIVTNTIISKVLLKDGEI